MKICPQCQSSYDEDYIYCLNDGNLLVDADDEQETVVVQRIFVPLADPGLATYCQACGQENKENSRFCKKCGASFTDEAPDSIIVPPVYTPDTPPAISPKPNNVLMMVGIVLGALLLIGIVVVAVSLGFLSRSGGNTSNGTSASGSNTNRSTLPENFDKDFDGNVNGNTPLTMHLHREKGNLTGSARTSKYDELSGSIDADGTFQVNGTPIGKPITGIWSGRIFPDGSITGEWSKPDGTSRVPFAANERSN